jgi:hypothetical protein
VCAFGYNRIGVVYVWSRLEWTTYAHAGVCSDLTGSLTGAEREATLAAQAVQTKRSDQLMREEVRWGAKYRRLHSSSSATSSSTWSSHTSTTTGTTSRRAVVSSDSTSSGSGGRVYGPVQGAVGTTARGSLSADSVSSDWRDPCLLSLEEIARLADPASGVAAPPTVERLAMMSRRAHQLYNRDDLKVCAVCDQQRFTTDPLHWKGTYQCDG